MPQNDYMDLFKKRFGKRFDHENRQRKKEARAVKDIATKAKGLHGIKGKIFAKERYKEKVAMRKTIKAHEQKDATVKDQKEKVDGAVPAYLLDRNEVNRTKVLSNMIK
jgi:ribosome biogenesis protein NSA2|tara:strand:+ start:22 stop:345 length:324 start_codon:yes stop_codon:yes gene_type:complete